MDVLIENGAIIAYRTKLRLSYKGTGLTPRHGRLGCAWSPASALVRDGRRRAGRRRPRHGVGRAWRELRRGASTDVARRATSSAGTGEPDSIEPGQLDVLDLLGVRDGRRMSDLAAALRVDPSTVTRTLQRMEAAGLARRAAGRRRRARRDGPPDRRGAAAATPPSRPAAPMIVDAAILDAFTPTERDAARRAARPLRRSRRAATIAGRPRAHRAPG